MVGAAEQKRSWTVHAEGVAAISSTDGTELTSDKDIVLRVGKSTLRLAADRIELVSPTVVARGTDAELSASDKGLRLSSKWGLDVLAKDRLFLGSGAGATLSLKSEFKADGARILLNSPEKADDPARPPPAPRTSVELVDETGASLAFQRFIVTLASGAELAGLTDKEGKAELYLEEAGTISFPDLTDAKNL